MPFSIVPAFQDMLIQLDGSTQVKTLREKKKWRQEFAADVGVWWMELHLKPPLPTILFALRTVYTKKQKERMIKQKKDAVVFPPETVTIQEE